MHLPPSLLLPIPVPLPPAISPPAFPSLPRSLLISASRSLSALPFEFFPAISPPFEQISTETKTPLLFASKNKPQLELEFRSAMSLPEAGQKLFTPETLRAAAKQSQHTETYIFAKVLAMISGGVHRVRSRLWTSVEGFEGIEEVCTRWSCNWCWTFGRHCHQVFQGST